ncbi:MAG: putative long chain acyl-CoA synthase [Solirubrobacteraceae bacterium]|nr:putative long chain acyl-CoA synthase [Solirubrobacteraceae bacterium]
MSLLSPLARIGAAAQNALEIARFGGLETGEEPSPYEVVSEQRMYRLRRYHASSAAAGPAVVLVPPMMLAADIYDVSERSSAVTVLHEHGIDPWVVDFGAPEHEEGGLERTLTDHVVAVSDAVDRVRVVTGRDVHLGGYSQGGMFCYQTAAYRRSEGLASVITFGAPVDTLGALPFGIPEELAVRGAGFLAEHVLARYALPAWASRAGFRLLDPVKSLRQQLDFLMALHDRQALLPRERQRQFLEARGWVAWPGPALADFVHQFVAHNRMLSGGFVIEDRLVTLADITLPVLTAVGEVDEIAPPRAVRAIRRAAPRAAVFELTLRAGHFGLVVGSTASRDTWPTVAAWSRWRDGELPAPPDNIRAIEEDEPDPPAPVATRVGVGIDLVSGVATGVARSLASTVSGAVGAARLLTGEAARQLPRLTRLERVQPHTRISVGLLLDEHAHASPGTVAFLFGDRAHTHGAVKERIDNVARGLLSLGVRQGEHVGVLMQTRPSAHTVVAALNRVGAVAVLLRPDGVTAREIELGECTRVVADPELSRRAREAGAPTVLVLGGGGRPRRLKGVVDMERIDPDAVRVPAWYAPNPGRASDLAFVLFTGEGERTRVNRITNGRWALSAFGTASSAALSEADTVYAVTPIYHPSGLLMSTGGAIAGGARLALATGFDPKTFWDEVRRYGATIASYTWTMLRDLVEQPPDPAERHHPIRLFVGAGMPRGLWRRVEERFAPARVLELYTSTDGEAVLVNLTGAKRGAKGRPLPGSAEVRVAAYDARLGRLEETDDGFARECARGEVGMLLARERPGVMPASDSPLRGIFERDDAWRATGDLFVRDLDDDHWLVDDVRGLIRTADGFVPALPIAEALSDLGAVDLAVAYALPAGAGGDGDEIAVAAITQRDRTTLTAADLDGALAALDPAQRPRVVHVVKEMPLTTWYRPRAAPLRAAGLPRAGRRAWHRDGDAYVQLTAAARRRLAGAVVS